MFWSIGISTMWGQHLGLAQNYLDHGDYAKAEAVYQELYTQRPTNTKILEGLVQSLQAQQKYTQAQEALQQFAKRVPYYPGINVELGHNFTLQNQSKAADKYYQKAIDALRRYPNRAYQIGQQFQRYNLIDYAIQTYRMALVQAPNSNFTLQLAQLYGMQGELTQMYQTFLDLIVAQPRYYYAVNRYFSKYITDDPEAVANKTLRQVLLKRVQTQPDPLYNRVLSWLYVQQNEFTKAFIQEKAVYARSERKNLSSIMQLAKTAEEKQAFSAAETMLNFVMQQAQTDFIKLNAAAALMQIKTKTTSTGQYKQVKTQYDTYLKQFGYTANSLKLQLQYAEFLAFKIGETSAATAVLKKALTLSVNNFEEARIKLALGDVLVAENHFNQALIYYSQIKYIAGQSPIAEESQFKVAQTSYFKGDFDWAQTQLKVLKQATDQRTANDALALNLLIEENRSTDSTQTGLRQFARADLLKLKGRPEAALQVVDSILNDFPEAEIRDDALLRAARLHTELQQFDQATIAYKTLITTSPESVLIDDAHYELADLYAHQLQQPEQAKAHYKAIIFDHPDSIYLVQARRAFRHLRDKTPEEKED